MKQSIFLSRFLLLATLAALLGTCGRAKQADPAPPECAVRVQVTGSDLAGGSVIITSVADYAGTNGAPVTQQIITDRYSTSANATYNLGKLNPADRVRVRVKIAMSGYSGTGKLSAAIVVDGVVKKQCYVTGGGLFETCELTTDSL